MKFFANIFLVVKIDNLKAGYFMKIIRLNTKTKNYINKLLQLQQKAIRNDLTDILNKINQILFTINEKWRNAMKKANPRNFEDYQMQQRLNNATCYKF